LVMVLVLLLLLMMVLFDVVVGDGVGDGVGIVVVDDGVVVVGALPRIVNSFTPAGTCSDNNNNTVKQTKAPTRTEPKQGEARRFSASYETK